MFEQQANLRSKVTGQLVDEDWEFTTTKDWFDELFNKLDGTWIWCVT